MKLKNYTVRRCKKDEYDKLIAFLHDYWSANHVFCRNKKIFEFQHGTAESGEYDFVIAVHNESGEIHAVLGYITTTRYNRNDTEVPEAVYGALWKARDDVKDKEAGKLGLAVLQYLLKAYPNSDYITLGLSKDSQSIYQALHFEFGAMNHYYVANPAINEFFIAGSPEIDDEEDNGEYVIREVKEVPAGMENRYHPDKNAVYIENRYLKHPFYHYSLLGVCKKEEPLCLWVTREIEVEGHRCIRIVDMIGDLEKIENMKGQIAAYLKERDAEYIDCYNYGIDKHVFLKAGFKEVGKATIIPNYFEPFEKKNVDIHYAAYAKKPIVVFKGDGDQDRPNLLGI